MIQVSFKTQITMQLEDQGIQLLKNMSKFFEVTLYTFGFFF